ncbi:MAG: hypothetical protein RJQ00_01975 [Vicingaceae bacterium]
MKKLLATFSFVLLFSIPSVLQAQGPPPNPGGGNGKPPCFPPPCIPIDGGLSWLLLAGAAYGGKKVFDSKNKESEEEIKA